jgi:hypothetical protein
MAAPESAASKQAGVMATSIQQTIFLSLDTLMTQTLRGDTSPRTIDRQLPAVITPRTIGTTRF